jgi:hypothetical protein
MKFLYAALFLIIFPLLSFTGIHKYYVSVTQIDYREDKRSVQITSRIFIDDLEKLLRERYDEGITLSSKDEPKTADLYIARYLKEKLKIRINNETSQLVFIGKEYDADIVRCYLEIEDVKHIETFEVSNKVLFDVFEDQQNIVKTKINAKQKSFIFYPQKDSAVLKFN